MGERSRLSPDLPMQVARWAPLAALTAINLFNYIDRYVISALLPQLQADLSLDDTAAGLLGTAFMVVYFIVSPLFGWLGDRFHRPRLLAFGVLLWSLATSGTGLCQSYAMLFVARAAVGIGESAYGSIAPSLITDLFRRLEHGRALSIFYLATPVGSALGYLLGGMAGKELGWRQTFIGVGLPGLLLCVLAYRLRDPSRAPVTVRDAAYSMRGSWQQIADALRGHVATVRDKLLSNRVYVGTVVGLTSYTFGLGGFAFWAPSFMMRERGYDERYGMLVFGGITVVTGAIGTLCGGWLGDWLRARSSKGYTQLNTIAVLIGGVAAIVCLRCDTEAVFLSALVVAQLSLFLITGPVNALIVGCVPETIRGTAMATSIFCIHLFGDAVSPVIIGRLSDHSTLRHAMTLIPVTFLLAAVVWATTLPKRRRSATL